MAQLLVIGQSSGGGGGGNNDRFAPKYLVGNTVAPFSDTPFMAGLAPGFQYFPDPGDGTGIAAALAAAANVPGDVWMRPGLYDLDAGAVVAPLVVPTGVIVRGSGRDTTIIRARTSGDQGVFIVSEGGGLLDMTVDVPVASGATAGSTAAVSVPNGQVTFERLGITISVAQGSTITDALFITLAGGSTFPASNAMDLIITADGDGAVPCRGLRMVGGPTESPILLARNIQVYSNQGMTVGCLLNDSVLVVSQIVVVNFSDTGVLWSGQNGSLRLDEGTLQTGAATAASVGLSLQSGGHVIRSIAISNNASTGGTGLLCVDMNTGVQACQIEDCIITGWDIGILGGQSSIPGPGANFQNNTISDCIIFAGSRGIYLLGPGVQTNQIIDNQVIVSQFASVPPLGGIIIEEDPQTPGARNNFIKGNRVSVISRGDPLVHAISLQSQSTVVEGNTCSIFSGGYAIALLDRSERCAVTGNTTDANLNWVGPDSLGCIYVGMPLPGTPNRRNVVNGNTCEAAYQVDPVGGLPAAIVYEGAQGVVNNNTVVMGTPSGLSPGITLTVPSLNSNCIGNVCEGNGGVPVTNLGAGNNVSNNIGV
jgi:hypothetical protein